MQQQINWQRLGFAGPPAPGHPIYEALGFVPLEERTPSLRTGGYAGEPLAQQERAAAESLGHREA